MRVKRIKKVQGAEALYLNHQRVVNHLAKKFAKKFGRPFDELKERAIDCLTEQVVVKWATYYDARRCKPITLIYQNIYFALHDHCVHKRWNSLALSEITEEPIDERSWFELFLEELGEEGRALARVICEAPEELAHLVAGRAPVRTKRVVGEYLERRAAWDEALFLRAWDQVEVAING